MKSLFFSFFFALCSIVSLAQTGKIFGTVTDKSNNEPIGFAPVVIQNTTTGSLTDDLGNYEIANLKPGLYNVEVNYVGYKKAIIFEIEVTNDRPANVNIQLEPNAVEGNTVIIVGSTISNREESPVSVRSIGTNEIKRNPGGNRDISRAIRSLPGVAAIPTFRNDIIIRGGAANENRFYIDGIEIPNINHFATQGANGGPVGLINVDLIQEVEFYSSAFPSARGNALSSVLEFGFKDPRRDKYTANFVVGSSDIGLTVEGPTGKNSSFVGSVRRSYLQGLFSVLELPFLPTYNDLNIKWKWDIDEKNKFTIIALGAYDQFDLNLKLAVDTTSENFQRNAYILDNLINNEQWNYTIGAKWEHYRENGKLTLVASRNALQNDAFKYENNDETLARTFDYSSRETENKLRLENKWNFESGWKAIVGVNYEWAEYFNQSVTPLFIPALDSTVTLAYRSDIQLSKYGIFAQTSKTFLDQRLTVSAGIRSDANDFGPNMKNPLDQLSPRLAARYAFAPQWSFNVSVGRYYQLPYYTALGFRQDDVLVNQDIRYINNDQAVAGFEYSWDARNTIITVEGFYKKYRNYPISLLRGISLANLGADFGVIGAEDIVDSGLGRSYGIEFLFQQKFFKGFYGILSYTFVRSEFAGLDNKYVPSSWDSRHLVSITGGKKIGDNWEIGGRFSFSGGLPYTPDNVAASMNIATWNQFGVAQTDWTRINSERIQAFHQLDIRIDRKWFFKKWTLDLFLDIQNVYNQQTLVKPILDVQRDAEGNPIVDPNNPNAYLPNVLENTSGSLLPSIGIIVEL